MSSNLLFPFVKSDKAPVTTAYAEPLVALVYVINKDWIGFHIF